MARAGLRQPNYNAINALPNAEFADLYKGAGLSDVMEVPPGEAFILRWRYLSGLDQESVRLYPGESIMLREVEAKAFIRTMAQSGGIIVPCDLSEEEYEVARLKEIVKAVKRLSTFFGDIGIKKVRELMQAAMPPRPFADLEDWKTDYYPYLLNQQKHLLLVKHGKKIAQQLAKAQKALDAISEKE